MIRWLFAVSLLLPLPSFAGSAADLARAIRETSFDAQECYRVRDLSIVKEDIKIYLGDGHLIFSQPVDGRRIAAVFVADVEAGDAEIILLPPDRAERRSLASYTQSPNLDEHFHIAVFMFTGDDYDAIVSQFPSNPANKRDPEAAPALTEQFTPTLRNLVESYLTRLVLDLMNRRVSHPGLFAGFISGATLGNFDVVYDPESPEQIIAGRISSRNDRLFFDSWTSFVARNERHKPRPPSDLQISNYRIEATINTDLSLNAVTRLTLRTATEGLAAVSFEITPQMQVTAASVDGQPAEVLEKESLRSNANRRGNNLFVVVPAEPLHAGRSYEFEFHHSGIVVHDTGDHVLFVSSRSNWYPQNGLQFTNYDLTFRYPRGLDLAAPGELVDDHLDGDWHITHRRTSAPIRTAGFNLGDYIRAKVERGGYVVEVCANRAVERNLRPAPVPPISISAYPRRSNGGIVLAAPEAPPTPDPSERLQALASDVASALQFMTARFGPAALPHLMVAPIPGTFGQGFPGLIYLSTLSYLRTYPPSRNAPVEVQDLFFRDILVAHETAHQWWGNRITGATYRDNWLMEALANYSALLYLEKTRGQHAVELTLDNYRTGLLAKGENGQPIDSAGPIILGGRLESSLEPTAWRAITYGKGTWIMQMLRRRIGDEHFLPMLAELLKRYDHAEISTDEFRLLAAHYLPPKSDDPQLETFFDQWVYGTGIPSLKMEYKLHGKAPSLRLTGTVTQSDVPDDFAALAPIEIHMPGGRNIVHWVRCGADPTSFSVALKQAPVKVTLDPNRAVLRR
jgi:hypothetical protein